MFDLFVVVGREGSLSLCALSLQISVIVPVPVPVSLVIAKHSLAHVERLLLQGNVELRLPLTSTASFLCSPPVFSFSETETTIFFLSALPPTAAAPLVWSGWSRCVGQGGVEGDCQ